MGDVVFSADQIITASEAVKRFGELKKRAALRPQFILSGGKVETVVVSFTQYEAQVRRLQELEEDALLMKRIERLEKDPDCAVSWEQIRRSGK